MINNTSLNEVHYVLIVLQPKELGERTMFPWGSRLKKSSACLSVRHKEWRHARTVRNICVLVCELTFPVYFYISSYVNSEIRGISLETLMCQFEN
jgi:hypothetical protein